MSIIYVSPILFLTAFGSKIEVLLYKRFIAYIYTSSIPDLPKISSVT